MKKRFVQYLGFSCSLLLLLAATDSRPSGQASTIAALPTLGGSLQVNGLNNAGQITGLSFLSDDPEDPLSMEVHAFRFSGGVTTDLGTLGGAFSQGLAIN